MIKTDLKNLYQRFLNFDKDYYFQDVKTWFGVRELKLNKKTLNQFYENYQRIPFFSFLRNVKSIIYSNTVFNFILKNSVEDWDLWYYLKFLEKEKIIKVKKNGKVSVLNKSILNLIPRPQTEKEIKAQIERKLKVKIKEREPVVNLFKLFKDFKVKAKWDQMPISQGSAIFAAKKILEELPLSKRFLLVGDDDFMSIILGLADPMIESLVIDADENLLDCLNFLASKFNLKIETRKTDIRKEKFLGEKFTGFLSSPVYTEEGLKEFARYGINQLGKDGGFVFLNLSDEAIGNRYLFLQDFFTKKNLIIREIIPGEVYYPWISLHQEDKAIDQRMFKMIDEKIVKSSPKLGASLWVFEYLPFKIKKIKFKKTIYSYL